MKTVKSHWTLGKICDVACPIFNHQHIALAGAVSGRGAGSVFRASPEFLILERKINEQEETEETESEPLTVIEGLNCKS